VFYGIAAPKGTPPEIVAILNKAFNDAQKDPKLLQRLHDLGSEPMPMTPAEFGKFTGDEIDKWAKVVKAANLSIE
jgi:tripartite-type tricarboxylate transporter receptor subunit TctC